MCGQIVCVMVIAWLCRAYYTHCILFNRSYSCLDCVDAKLVEGGARIRNVLMGICIDYLCVFASVLSHVMCIYPLLMFISGNCISDDSTKDGCYFEMVVLLE